jgi:hypothetical protein
MATPHATDRFEEENRNRKFNELTGSRHLHIGQVSDTEEAPQLEEKVLDKENLTPYDFYSHFDEIIMGEGEK